MSAARETPVFGWQIQSFKTQQIMDAELAAWSPLCSRGQVTGNGRFLLCVVRGAKGSRDVTYSRHGTLKAAKQARDAAQAATANGGPL